MPKQTFLNLPEPKRERIMAAAVEEFAERGYKLGSISRIVAAAGIAKGSFYQYFEDKDDLYVHIIHTRIAERKLLVYEQEKDRLKDLNLTEFLRLVFRRQIDEFLQEPGLLKIAGEMPSLVSEPVYQKVLGPYQNMVDSYFLPYIQHEIEQGEIDRRVSVPMLNFMLISLGQYLMSRLSAGEEISPRMIDRIVDDLEYILTHGIYTGYRAGHAPDGAPCSPKEGAG